MRTRAERLEHQRKYNKGPVAKAAVKRWRASDKGKTIIKASVKKYRASDLCKKTIKTYKTKHKTRYKIFQRMNTLRRGIKRWTERLIQTHFHDSDYRSKMTKIEIKLIIRDYKRELKELIYYIKENPIKEE